MTGVGDWLVHKAWPPVKKVLDSSWYIRLMNLVAILMLTTGLIVGSVQIRFNTCVVDWMDENSQGTQARAAATQADREALDRMIRTVADGSSGLVVRQALLDYLQARDDADRQRAEHPVADGPSTVCR